MSATQRATVPGNAPVDEEGSSSKQAASAVTAFGAAPGKTPPAAAHSGALSIHETAERLPSPVAATVRTTSCYVSHWKSDNEGSEDGGDDSEGSDDDGDDSEDDAGTTLSSRGKDDYDDAAEHARGHHDGILRGYTAPSHDEIKKLANHGVLQPPVPNLVQLMSLRSWRRGILYAMGEEGMAAAQQAKGSLVSTKEWPTKNKGCDSFVISCVTKTASSSTATLKSVRRCYSSC